MSLPKRNSADGRCYWMKPEVQEELQPLFDQCIQDAIDGRITRLDSLWPPVVVSSEGAPFEVWQLLEVQEELQPLFDQCIQDAIDGRITRLDSLWPPVVVSSEGAPFEVWQLLRTR